MHRQAWPNSLMLVYANQETADFMDSTLTRAIKVFSKLIVHKHCSLFQELKKVHKSGSLARLDDLTHTLASLDS